MSQLIAHKAAAGLSPVDAEALARDGYRLLRGVIPADWIEPLRAAFEAGYRPSNDWPVPRGADWRHALVDLDPVVQQVCRLPELLTCAGQLLRQPFFLAGVEGREPCAGGGYQSLHRDGPNIERAETVTVLAYVDPFGPDNGATRVVAATHRGQGLTVPAGLDDPAALQLSGEAGDVLVLDGNLLHCGARNITGASRRSLLITYAVLALRDDYDRTRALRLVRMSTDDVFGA